MSQLTPEELKAIQKAAFKEFIDEKAKEFGYWSFKFFGSAFFGYLAYVLLSHEVLSK